MKLELETTIPEIEFANFLLDIAYREAVRSTEIQKRYNIRPGELDQADDFRKKLVAAYFAAIDKLPHPCAE